MSFNTFVLVLNWVSLVAALLVVGTMCVLGSFNYELVNRVSLRLQLGIAVLGVVQHIAIFFIQTKAPIGCVVVAFVVVLSDVWYLALNITLALNVMLMFLLEKTPKLWWENAFWIITAAFSITVASIPLLLELYGRHKDTCAFLHEPRMGYYYNEIIYLGFRLITVTFCLVVSICILVKLFSNRCAYSHHLVTECYIRGVPFNHYLKRLFLCTSLYPLACFLSQVGGVLGEISQHQGLASISLLCKVIVGILSLLAFLFDSTIQRGIVTYLRAKFPCIFKRDLVQELQEPYAEMEIKVRKSSNPFSSQVRLDELSPYHTMDKYIAFI
ncbi:hypothetical protein DSO57_1035194 [Entomophthora muscae]|uniref:Uncharacterized protein n=1 Tax=Entomophthora muscae TaxID=34485 RepID=A0ACC2TY47_9FUNG|nr:hypothetical protein DSO57_1035194 [Entomophthora muscae]